MHLEGGPISGNNFQERRLTGTSGSPLLHGG